jgi:hypothetical protein
MARSNRNIILLLLAVFLITWSVLLNLIPVIGGLWVMLAFLAITGGGIHRFNKTVRSIALGLKNRRHQTDQELIIQKEKYHVVDNRCNSSNPVGARCFRPEYQSKLPENR